MGGSRPGPVSYEDLRTFPKSERPKEYVRADVDAAHQASVALNTQSHATLVRGSTFPIAKNFQPGVEIGFADFHQPISVAVEERFATTVHQENRITYVTP